MSQTRRFMVCNTMSAENIEAIEMDEDLLRPDADIIDPDSFTMRTIKGGGVYTLVPIEDHTIAALLHLRKAYEITTKQPQTHLSGMINRVDEVMLAVGNLFKEISYIVVKSKEDMNRIINPKEGYEHERVTYSIFDDLASAVDEGWKNKGESNEDGDHSDR